MKSTRRFGFTLIELLVVISIIAILIGLMSAGLNSAIANGKNAKEMNRLKQVLYAWTMYSGQYDDQLLPGFLEKPVGGPGVQEAWQLHYRKKNGDELSSALCQTYTWRLAPYLDYNIDPILGYRSDGQEKLDNSTYNPPFNPLNYPASLMPLVAAAGPAADGVGAALQPAFGYNAYYLGGWWEMVSGTPTLKFGNDRCSQDGVLTPTSPRGRIVARTIGGITKPSEIIVFSTSTFLNQRPEPYSNFNEYEAGAPWVCPDRLGIDVIWRFGGVVLEEADVASDTSLTPTDRALAYLLPVPAPRMQGDIGRLIVDQSQAVPFARHGKKVAVGSADGSCRTTGITELNDLRLWVPSAEALKFIHGP